MSPEAGLTKALKYYDRKTVKMETVLIPPLEEDEVLVETKACGICSSDIMDWYREPHAPAFFGHEPAGVIVKTGPRVKGFRLGDRVFVHHHVPCFVCRYCRKGDYSMCLNFRENGIYPGGFSQFIKVQGENVRRGLLTLPSSLPFVNATLIEPIACCLQAIHRAGVSVGDTVVVVGAGFNGLILTFLSKIFGSQKTIVIEPNEFRLELASRLGADGVVNPEKENLVEAIREINEGRLADVVLVTPPFPQVLESSISLVDRGGILLLYAPSAPGESFAFPIYQVYFSQITIKTSYSASPIHTREALQLLNNDLIDVDQLVTTYSFSDFEKAFSAVRNDKKLIKAVLEI